MKLLPMAALFILPVLFCCKAGYGQSNVKTPSDTTATDTISVKHRYFLFGMDLGNNFSYKDRPDQVTYPYLYPNVTYKAKSGYFASLGAFRVSNVQANYNISPWLELDLATGWKFNLGENDKLSASYNYSAYNRNFPLLGSALSNDLIASYSHDFDWLYSKLSFDYSFGKLGGDSVAVIKKVGKKNQKTVEKATFFSSHDYFLTLNLSHEFTWDDVFKKDDEISIEPGVYIETGTNNFYDSYYKHAKALSQAKKKGQKVSSETDTLSDPYDGNAATYKVREYIFSLPVAYIINRFTITAEYNYIIPVNQPSDPDFAIHSYALFKLSLDYKLKLKK